MNRRRKRKVRERKGKEGKGREGKGRGGKVTKVKGKKGCNIKWDEGDRGGLLLWNVK